MLFFVNKMMSWKIPITSSSSLSHGKTGKKNKKRKKKIETREICHERNHASSWVDKRSD